MTAIGASERGAHPKTAFDEVQSVAHGAADAVIGNPVNDLVHAALVHQVLDQPACGIVGEGGDVGSLETEAPLKPARDVIFASAFENLKLTRRCNAVIARIEAQHDLAEAELVPTTLGFGFDIQWHGVKRNFTQDGWFVPLISGIRVCLHGKCGRPLVTRW